MAVKIRLKRMGKIRQPHYRIVVADSRTKRDGRVIEEIGKYHPKQEPSFIEVDSERVQYWLGVGAQPSEPVTAILKVTGDWQKFKGEPAPEPMKVAEPKRDKTEIFNEALKDSTGDTRTEAVTRKKSPAKKAAVDQPAAETTEAPAAEATEAPKTAETAETPAEAEAPAAEAEATAEETSEATATDAETKSSEAGTEEAPAAEGAQADEKTEA